MINRLIKYILVLVIICISLPGFSQEKRDSLRTDSICADSIQHVFDSLTFNRIKSYDIQKKPPVIKLTTEQAIKVLEKWHQEARWNNTNDPFRRSIGQLIAAATYPSFDSAEYFLNKYPFDSLKVAWDKFYIWEPVQIRIPYLSKEKPADSTALNVIPQAGLKDTTVLVIIDTLNAVSSKYRNFPFKDFNFPYQSDSIQTAVKSLIDYVIARDSSIVYISGSGKAVTPIWLNSKTDLMSRYWLKNDMNDSVTVWIGTPSRKNISLYLEKGVNFRKPVKSDDTFDPRIDIKPQDRSKLLAVQKIITKKQDWKYKTESSFLFSQSALSNWVKGGDNSITLATDITGYANYSNPELKLSSNNFARIKFGFLASGGNGLRKNLDLVETNSKLNHKAFGKFDFSAIMLFKTQLAPGKRYTKTAAGADTGIVVSKLFNPAILTMGIGLDYKPDKNTSINLSPLSYKGTFVLNPNSIEDATKYGVPKGKTSKIEPGASFMITNTFNPVPTVAVTNRLQLFTNYINNPQNVDVDWEVIAVATLNWFTEIRLNTHLIFDDDTKTTVMEGGNPVLNADNKTPKQTARIQWKEMLGFSFIFKF